MEITLEQSRVFDAVVRLGTIQKAAVELGKAHSAVVYALKSLEDQTGLQLFDRSAHRNRTTLEGEMVLKYCRQLLTTRQELQEMCLKIKRDWEPSLKLIYDGIIDFNFIGDALFQLHKMRTPTEVKVLSAHLHEVEDLFAKESADLMVTILPLQRLQIPSFRLKPICMHLVSHRDHSLGRKSVVRWTQNELNQQTFIRIKTDPTHVGLGTEQMKFDSHFFVNDFMTKKMAIQKCLGFGWLPDYLIQSELKSGVLKTLKAEIDSTHTICPRLYHRPEPFMGNAARKLLQFFKS